MTLQEIVQQLQAQAQPRPDLGADRPYTFAGRVGLPAETVLQMLQRMPQGELEGGGSVLGNLRDPLTLATIQNILKKKQLAEAVTEGPLNPRDVVLTPAERAMQAKLPVAARSFQTAEDIARKAAGEVLPEHGSALPDIPREPVRGSLEFFQQMLRKLGL